MGFFEIMSIVVVSVVALFVLKVIGIVVFAAIALAFNHTMNGPKRRKTNDGPRSY